MATFALTTATLATLGPNCASWFGPENVTPSNAAVYTTPLPREMTSADILSTLAPSPLTLDVIAGHANTVSKAAKHLFFVVDATSTLRAVLAFRMNNKWQFIAREIDDPDRWFNDPDDGPILIYSSTPFTG